MKETIRNWIKQLCKEEFPADNIVALNFGVVDQAERSAKDGVMHNLAGQVVDKTYKGIVIMNGKKYMNK